MVVAQWEISDISTRGIIKAGELLRPEDTDLQRAWVYAVYRWPLKTLWVSSFVYYTIWDHSRLFLLGRFHT